MTIAYLDCFSGVSGDMLLAAFLDAGMPEEYLRQELAKLPLAGYSLTVSKVSEQGIAAHRLEVDCAAAQPLRHLDDLTAIIEKSALTPLLKKRVVAVLTALAEAEAAVHGVGRNEIHFHEIGAVDTIVDVVGAVIAYAYFSIDRLVVSPLPMGRGFVDCAHGRLPLPAPAVGKLLAGLPVYGVGLEHELITPTGAALVKILADDFGPMPAIRLETLGHGAGARRSPDGAPPNLLRLFLGKEEIESGQDQVRILTTNLDDWQSETFPYVAEALFKAGALDVCLTPTLMKKGRPGHILQVMCRQESSAALENIIFKETTAIGLRYRDEARRLLPRKMVKVATPWGTVAAKKVSLPEGERIYPEYEECRQLAEKTGQSIAAIYQAVGRATADGGKT
ncbi:MAG: nickel pincer cofactor biosynthesis protein LarC [Desulfobulbaceae bacterium]|jgi:uncharacterized protein (TIGR00299 family) protein|nr:nickel pincer cofactor biosynthesis protein LarC [Desulfobulbaceae bacterium]